MKKIFNIFKSNKNNKDNLHNEIVSPTNGQILDLSEVPDEVFSQKLMGDGFAMKSNDGIILSPINGTVEMIFETKHAIGLKDTNGKEILIHLGIDTVNLKGEGFNVFVNIGDKIKVGDKLIEMDLDFIKANAPSDISPVIFTNLNENESVSVITGDINALEKNRIFVK